MDPRFGPLPRARRARAARHAVPRKDGGARHRAVDFIGIVFCMMFGTAALPPHPDAYPNTTPSCTGARVGVLVAVLHLPAVLHRALPGGAANTTCTRPGSAQLRIAAGLGAAWSKVDPVLLNITDINRDGIVRGRSGDRRRPDVLATPRIAGLPYLVSACGRGRPGGGALDRRWSSDHRHALSHDLYYKMIDPHASTTSG